MLLPEKSLRDFFFFFLSFRHGVSPEPEELLRAVKVDVGALFFDCESSELCEFLLGVPSSKLSHRYQVHAAHARATPHVYQKLKNASLS